MVTTKLNLNFISNSNTTALLKTISKFCLSIETVSTATVFHFGDLSIRYHFLCIKLKADTERFSFQLWQSFKLLWFFFWFLVINENPPNCGHNKVIAAAAWYSKAFYKLLPCIACVFCHNSFFSMLNCRKKHTWPVAWNRESLIDIYPLCLR